MVGAGGSACLARFENGKAKPVLANRVSTKVLARIF
jgi:hypothetical protein